IGNCLQGHIDRVAWIIVERVWFRFHSLGTQQFSDFGMMCHLPAGQRSQNVDSRRMVELIESFTERFDCVGIGRAGMNGTEGADGSDAYVYGFILQFGDERWC